ncbi:xanthine dehydrogenase family protein molybdopterin-binding subunit [Oceanicella sp. SM1341]|uniref:xanthine dehydrogenase family protein molybdopterin-binding subunit n=1 Tax=Oceanicella sp. SM1341 TaxID=1548889 RepID=UPI000E53BC65|nr:xanthine dehydrogenase family protein molybdopterin-binding subunit [Oceanicella sp. SM1341]
MAIGDIITRVDAPTKTTGQAIYANDVNLRGQLYAAFVGATVPSGRIVSIDPAAALAIPGVVRVLTEADMPRPAPSFADLYVPPLATRHIPLQGLEIAHEGEPVAMVLAETLEAAEAGARAVDVVYDAAAFTDPALAEPVDPDPGRGDYSFLDIAEFEKGDAAAAIAAAPVRIARTYTQPSRHSNPMEPCAVIAEWSGGRVTIHDTIQHVAALQGVITGVFGLEMDQVHVRSIHCGGGFGPKGFIWPHQILVPMAARVVGRPVKLALTRAEMYALVGMQPHMVQEVELGADENGRLLGISHIASNETGVTEDYIEFSTVPSRTYYACDAIYNRQYIRRGNVTLPTYQRSPAEGPGSWALGSAMDELARELDMDPLDLRLANYADVEPSSGEPWSSKMLREAYEMGAERFGWRNRPAGGTRDGHWRLGYGMADSSQGTQRYGSSARVRLRADGTAVVESSFSDIGTGSATVMRQIAADILGLDESAVSSREGDSVLPEAGPTWASATVISTGTAVHRAATEVRGRLARLAGWPADAVGVENGALTHEGEARPIRDILAEAGVSEVSGDGTFTPNGGEFSDAGPEGFPSRVFGVIFVEVAVDPELGLLRLRRATGVYSAGRIINPRTARSQMTGGIIWGWGMAAMEQSRLDPVLGRWLSKDLAGVAIPTNADIPELDVAFVDEFDERSGPLGAKGIGELGATGVAAAVANAVYDAIGLRVRELPITPEKILAG